MARIRVGKKKATPPKRGPKHPPAKRRNPFLKLQGKEVAFDLIIPISNGGFNDFAHRANNLELILAELPPQVHAVVVEQIIAVKNPKYRTKVKTSCNHTWLTVSAPVFNKPWLYNIGARNSKSNRLLFSEADIALEKHYFPSLLAWLNIKKYQWAVAWNRLVYWQQDMIRHKPAEKPSRGGPEGGVVYMAKPFFWNIGGYNEWMRRLGGIDNEIIRRAESQATGSAYFPWTIDHLWHPYSPYKTSPTRDINRQIYKWVKKNPKEMIRILKQHAPQAGGKVPLCKSKKPEWLL